ncbi:MAG: hypothetical protein AVDCRST_MAG73-1904, partial [uncultured Thermomicrobiales bacterium]
VQGANLAGSVPRDHLLRRPLVSRQPSLAPPPRRSGRALRLCRPRPGRGGVRLRPRARPRPPHHPDHPARPWRSGLGRTVRRGSGGSLARPRVCRGRV